MKKNLHPSKVSITEFQFLYDYVLVQAVKPEANENGLIKPDQYDDKPELGVVVTCGEGKLLEDGTIVPLKVKKGDIIFFGKYSSMQTRSNGEDYFIIRSEDIQAVLPCEA